MWPQLGVIFCLVALPVGLILAAPSRHDVVPFDVDTGPRIINGTLAMANDTRHQVSVRKRLNDGYFFGTGHICGGALIAPDVVLSAAHCFVDYVINNGTYLPDNEFIAVMGNLDRFERNNNTLVYEIKKIVKGIDVFNLSTYEKDIALLFLNDSVPLNHPAVRQIQLNRQTVPDGTICQVTGWGRTEAGYLSDFLMTLDVPFISRAVCGNTSQTDFSEGSIGDGMVCAGYLMGEKDACGGDSGGPLICAGRQAGIVSWGSGCALPRLPGVYTDVQYYYPWIEQHIKANNGGNDGAMAASTASLLLIAALATLAVFITGQ